MGCSLWGCASPVERGEESACGDPSRAASPTQGIYNGQSHEVLPTPRWLYGQLTSRRETMLSLAHEVTSGSQSHQVRQTLLLQLVF